MNTLAYQMSFDNSKFITGMEQARAAMAKAQEVGEKLHGAMTAIQGVGLAVTGLGTAFAAFESVQTVVENVMGIFEKGHALEVLHRQTGESIQDLVVMEKAFKLAGLQCGDMGHMIAMLQKSLGGVNEQGEPTKKIFDKMGLSISALKAMSVPEALQAIGDKMQKLPSAADRTAAAMAIFGRSGAEMLALLNDPGAMAEAIKSAKEIGEIYARNAVIFSKVELALAAIHAKVAGLFVGIAEGVAPILQPILDKINKLDFTRVGKQIGAIIGTLQEAFKKGQLGELVSLSLQVGFGEAVNYLTGALQACFTGLTNIIPDIFTGDVYAALVEGFMAATEKLGAFLLDVFKEPIIKIQAALQYAVENMSKVGGEKFLKSLMPGLSLLDKFFKTGLFDKAGKFLGDATNKALGISDTGRSYKEIENERRAEGVKFYDQSPADMSATGDRLAKLAGDTIAPTIESISKKLQEAIAAGIKPVELFRTGPMKDQLEALYKALDSTRNKVSAAIDPEKKPGSADARDEGSHGKMKIDAVDRFAKVGLFAGGGPALDYARRTADAAQKIAEYLTKGPGIKMAAQAPWIGEGVLA